MYGIETCMGSFKNYVDDMRWVGLVVGMLMFVHVRGENVHVEVGTYLGGQKKGQTMSTCP